jgi:preprotein translocase subunit SecD
MRSLLLAVILIAATGCGGHDTDKNWFLISGEAGIGPTMTIADVARDTAKVDTAPTGEPVVLLSFTAEGTAKFERLTRAVAHRGAKAGRPFHVLIEVDGRALTRPYIDYRLNPDGISGQSGIEITGFSSRGAAERLARRLRGG